MELPARHWRQMCPLLPPPRKILRGVDDHSATGRQRPHLGSERVAKIFDCQRRILHFENTSSNCVVRPSLRFKPEGGFVSVLFVIFFPGRCTPKAAQFETNPDLVVQDFQRSASNQQFFSFVAVSQTLRPHGRRQHFNAAMRQYRLSQFSI